LSFVTLVRLLRCAVFPVWMPIALTVSLSICGSGSRNRIYTECMSRLYRVPYKSASASRIVLSNSQLVCRRLSTPLCCPTLSFIYLEVVNGFRSWREFFHFASLWLNTLIRSHRISIIINGLLHNNGLPAHHHPIPHHCSRNEAVSVLGHAFGHLHPAFDFLFDTCQGGDSDGLAEVDGVGEVSADDPRE
jgi:hypothetical protein